MNARATSFAVLKFAAPAVRNAVRLSQRGGKHRLGRRGSDAVVASDAEHGGGTQANARNIIVLKIDARDPFYRLLEHAVQ